MNAGEVELLRECIGFEERHFSASDLYPQYPQNCLSEKKTGEGLTSAGDSGNLASPNYMRRNKRLSSLPRAGKSLVRISAAEAPIMSNGRLSHIGRVATSSIREDWRHHVGRGALSPCLLFSPNYMRFPMSDLLSRVPVSDADHPAPQNHAAEQEQFLEEYKRNMGRLLNASEGFCVLHQLLAGDESRDVLLDDSGRSGLALILKLLGDESMDAWSRLPNEWEMKKFLRGGGQDHE